MLATALSVIPLVLPVFMPNWYLGDGQNAVEEAAGLVGRRGRGASRSSEDREGDEDEESGLARGSGEELWCGR